MLPSIKVGDFDADTVSSEIIMRNLSHSGCLQFQYGSTNAADAFRLKIAVINRRSRTYLQNFIVSGRLFKLNFRLLSTNSYMSLPLGAQFDWAPGLVSKRNRCLRRR